MVSAALAALIEASQRAHLDLSVYEWRDVCYLAAQLDAPRLLPQTVLDAATPADPVADPPVADAVPDLPAPPDPDPVVPPASDAGGQATFLAYPGPPVESSDQLPVRAPTVPALSRAPFAKAFRYLKRTVDSPVESELDVAATVRQAAETDVWDPVLVPAADRWLRVAVIVDDAASGPAWSQEISALLRALEESGAFGGVRVWHFDSDTPSDSPLTVRGRTAAAVGGRDTRELIDPSGRRAVLVLSDCVGAGWGDGRVAAMIDSWAAANPVAVVQLLPQRLWGRCRPRLVPVDWRAGRPFTAGNPPACRPRRDVAPPAGAMVPVFDLTDAAMARWAKLVVGATPEWTPGTALWVADGAPAARADVDGDILDGAIMDGGTADGGAVDGDTSDGGAVDGGTVDRGSDIGGVAAERSRLQVARFRAVASPPAFRLATLLSTAPLQTPVIRMIQRVALGAEQPAYWAEILLSGLVYRVADGAPVEGPHHLAYDFADGVREQLLTRLTRREALDMLYEVSDFVTNSMGGTLDFLALLVLDGVTRLSDTDRAFARVAVKVLRALGGSYADKATQLSALLADHEVGDDPTPAIGTNAHHSGTMDGTRSRDGDLVTAPNLTDTPKHGRPREASRATIWDVPPRISHFTGRKALLESLRQELVDNPNRAAVLVPRALFGLGGVGKTALANEYAHRYGGDYDVVWWIPAEDPADVRRSLVQLSRELRLPEFTDQSETIRNLLRALGDGYPKARWLLVYDNAAAPTDIDELLPPTTRHGHVLITSRDQAWDSRGTLLQVDAFTRDESTALLRRRATQLTAEEAEHLAGLLEDLPLALNQAAAWHDETGLPASEYLRRYDEKLALLPQGELLPEYPRPVGAAFGVSYDQLRTRSIAAGQLLQLCSHFGPEAISVDMLWRGRYVPDLPQPLRGRILDRTWLKRELREISRYELIQYDQARARFQLHRLVQRVLRSTLMAADRETTPLHAQAILARANPGNPDEVEIQDRAKHAELSPHILPSNIVESIDTEARKVVLDQIRFRYLVGDYEGSRELARYAVDRWEQRFGEDDEQVLLAKRHLATTLRASGEPIESLRLNEHVLRLFRDTLGEDHEHSLATANGYASALRTMGRFQEALEIDRDNLRRHRAILRDDDPATLRTANNYAVDLRLMGDFNQARQLDESTVRLWAASLGPDDPETLFAISNLVRDLYGQGRYGEALTMQQEAIAAQEAVVGPAHPNVLLARRTVAMLLRKLGRYQQARERAEANHAAYIARFPEYHEHTLAATMSLSNALRDEHRDVDSLRRARQLCEGALVLYRRAFPGHPFIQVCMANLAVVLRSLGEVAEARALNTAALAELRDQLGERHPYTLCAATNLASDLAAAGDYAAACELSSSALALSRDGAVRGPDHPYTLGCALNHALDLDAVGRADEAAALWSDTHPRFVAVLGPDHPDSLRARDRRRIDADIEPPPT